VRGGKKSAITGHGGKQTVHGWVIHCFISQKLLRNKTTVTTSNKWTLPCFTKEGAILNLHIDIAEQIAFGTYLASDIVEFSLG
jgi:hypothetical protein